ncbi:hypothetical protein GCM10027399_21800 [Curvibacter fontanus]
MAMDVKNSEVGLRFSVPAEMADVYERLRSSAPKRRSFEALHLMRLGLAFERLSQGGMLATVSGRVASVGPAAAPAVTPEPVSRPEVVEQPSAEERQPIDGGFFEVR